MELRPVQGRVTISRDGVVLADSEKAVRVLEVGKAMYDPVIYVPAEDVRASLSKIEKTTHCPLKGDAVYFAVEGVEMAWSYESPFDFAAGLTGRRAFWANKVTIAEAP